MDRKALSWARRKDWRKKNDFALIQAADRYRTLGEYPLANYLRALMTVQGRAAEMLGEDEPEENEIRVNISDI